MIRLLPAPPSAAAGSTATEALAEEVRTTEAAFARTMADRDYATFQTFLADETIFVGLGGPRRGKTSVAEEWKQWYQGKVPPFSWSPETVLVLDSGGLGLSSGGVFDPSGKRIGTFDSIWRREKGRWRIVFDKRCLACDGDPRGEHK